MQCSTAYCIVSGGIQCITAYCIIIGDICGTDTVLSLGVHIRILWYCILYHAQGYTVCYCILYHLSGGMYVE